LRLFASAGPKQRFYGCLATSAILLSRYCNGQDRYGEEGIREMKSCFWRETHAKNRFSDGEVVCEGERDEEKEQNQRRLFCWIG